MSNVTSVSLSDEIGICREDLQNIIHNITKSNLMEYKYEIKLVMTRLGILERLLEKAVDVIDLPNGSMIDEEW